MICSLFPLFIFLCRYMTVVMRGQWNRKGSIMVVLPRALMQLHPCKEFMASWDIWWNIGVQVLASWRKSCIRQGVIFETLASFMGMDVLVDNCFWVQTMVAISYSSLLDLMSLLFWSTCGDRSLSFPLLWNHIWKCISTLHNRISLVGNLDLLAMYEIC